MELRRTGWIRLSLINLLILALIGVVLRYKIVFYLPFIDQKHLLHGHSHFAFSGWVGMALMILMTDFLESSFKQYTWLLWANLATSYAMLICFSLEGYGIISIISSSLSIVVSYLFAVYYWRDLGRRKNNLVSHKWLRLSLLFSVLSSAGAFALAMMMSTGIVEQNWYLAAEYFFLHFQYNGWFFFACIGLITAIMERNNADRLQMESVFNAFAVAAVPAFGLSILWADLPAWLYAIVVVSVMLQLYGWYRLTCLFNKHIFRNSSISKTGRTVLLLSFIALSIKLWLQAGSVIPALSKLAFGFRPIVIGYLHLVLLGFTSLFIIGYAVSEKLIGSGSVMKAGLFIFASGIILNEILLMLQGLTGIYYIPVPAINESLFAAAIIMFSGVLTINLSACSKSARQKSHDLSA